MEDHGELQKFADELPKALWDALEGRAEVGFDSVTGTACKNDCVLVVKTENQIFVRDIGSLFYKYMEKDSQNIKKTTYDLKEFIERKDRFFADSLEDSLGM